jgi:hypothetical protein
MPCQVEKAMIVKRLAQFLHETAALFDTSVETG